jgi:hypothetical protein
MRTSTCRRWAKSSRPVMTTLWCPPLCKSWVQAWGRKSFSRSS